MRNDPFVQGPFEVQIRTIEARDAARDRLFPIEIWSPSEPGTYPLILFSHSSGGGRNTATYLCSHLASHGYVVGAMDHSEVVVKDLKRPESETDERKAARIKEVVQSRVPDLRFLLDQLLKSETNIDSAQIGAVGHSFGGWTVLAAPGVEPRIRSVVALAPGGNSNPKPGILRAPLTLDWGRDVPTLYLVAEGDVSLPLDGMYELFEKTRSTKQMVILRRADHLHFMDNVEELHELIRNNPMPGELSWIAKEMRPISELHSGEQAHVFVRGLTLSHFDATLKQRPEARQFLTDNLQVLLENLGIDSIAHHT